MSNLILRIKFQVLFILGAIFTNLAIFFRNIAIYFLEKSEGMLK